MRKLFITMSQQQIKTYNQSSLYEKYSKTLMREADLNFAEKHFKIKGYKEENFLKAYLFSDSLCEDNCEVVNFLNKKLRGALGDENIELVKLKSIQTKYQDINNYYTTNNEEFSWTETAW
jgi:hypothetical protein